MFYLIHNQDVGPNKRDSHGFMTITTQPGRKNMSHEICTDGWLGTTNDNDSTAYGEYETLEDARAAAAKRGFTEPVETDDQYSDYDDDGERIDIEYWQTPTDAMEQWDVDDYLDMSEGDITAEMSDDDLTEWISGIETNAESENFNIHGSVEDWANEIRFEKRRDEIESVLDDLKTVAEYKNESDDDENPDYIVRFENGRIAYLSYDDGGKMKWRRSNLISTGLSSVELGIAECNLYRKTKPAGGDNPRRRPIEPATAYDAARCEAVTQSRRDVCRKYAVAELMAEFKKDFLAANATKIEEIKKYDSTMREIYDLEKRIAYLKSSLPVERPTIGYFSTSCTSYGNKLRNLNAHPSHEEMMKMIQ